MVLSGQDSPASGSIPEPALVVLLARALRRYRRAIRARLQAEGFGDLPQSGSWLLGALRQGPLASGEVARRLGTSKQGMSRLADAMVERGYLGREADLRDRRRVRLQLTARGRVAAVCVLEAVAAVDRELEARAGPGRLEGARRQLAALLRVG